MGRIIALSRIVIADVAIRSCQSRKLAAVAEEEVASVAAASVFEGGGLAEGAASEAQVDVLYRQIGQLKVENDFLARKLGK
jgi:hypothetical protein